MCGKWRGAEDSVGKERLYGMQGLTVRESAMASLKIGMIRSGFFSNRATGGGGGWRGVEGDGGEVVRRGRGERCSTKDIFATPVLFDLMGAKGAKGANPSSSSLAHFFGLPRSHEGGPVPLLKCFYRILNCTAELLNLSLTAELLLDLVDEGNLELLVAVPLCVKKHGGLGVLAGSEGCRCTERKAKKVPADGHCA